MEDPNIKIQLSQNIANVFGLHFHQNQWNSLARNLTNVAKELNIPSDLLSLNSLISKGSFNDLEFDALSKHLTVGETYFYRENVALEFFKNDIIPKLISARAGKNQHLRIWSAGCSTGEEPYTLAMILRELVKDIDKWKIDILATDINKDALRRAKTGLYPAWSFRETSEAIKQKYFTRNGKHFNIIDPVKQMVHFTQLNLANGRFPSQESGTQYFDIIFCRNVLMYFLPETAMEVARRFHLALNDDGWLITSQVELNDEYFSLFARRMFGQGIFYQKSDKNADSKNKIQLVEIHSERPIVKKRIISPARSKTDTARRQVNEAGKVPITGKRTNPQAALQNKMNAARLFADAKYHECAVWCEHYMAGNPFDRQIAILLIKSYANSGKLQAARQWAERLMPFDGTNTESMYLYATILMEQNEWELAEKILTKTLYLNPTHPAANLNMASTLKRLGKNNPAKKYFENTLALLDNLDDNEIVPELEGITAGRLRQMIKMMTT